jgi:uncharacterized protein YjiS (DUF1127 family)
VNASALLQQTVRPTPDVQSPAASFGRIARSTPLLHARAGTPRARSANESDVVSHETATAVARRAERSSGFGEALLGCFESSPAAPAGAPPAAKPTAIAVVVAQPAAYELHQRTRSARDRAVADLATAVLRTSVAQVGHLIAAYRRQRDVGATVQALRALDARTLRDLGIDACEIRSIAAELGGAAEATRLRVETAPGR